MTTTTDPRGIANDPRGIATDPRGIANDPRGIANDPRGIANDPHRAARATNKKPKPREPLDVYLRRMHRDYRYGKGEVAAKIPITRVAYRAWYTGKSTPDADKLPAIARALAVPEEWLTQYAGRYKYPTTTLRAILRDDRLLREFIDRPIQPATRAWVLQTLRELARHLYKKT